MVSLKYIKFYTILYNRIFLKPWYLLNTQSILKKGAKKRKTMHKYNCTLCGAILFPDEAICHYDRIHGDVYVSCPYCRSQCERYSEAEDGEDVEEREKEEEEEEEEWEE